MVINRPGGLMFHHFHNQEKHRAGEGSLSVDDLCAVLDHYAERILPARTFLVRACAGTLEPGDLCLTFDDSLKSQVDIALPVLAERGLTAFWFVYSSVFTGNTEPLEIYRYIRTQCFDSFGGFYCDFMAAVLESPWAAAARTALADFDPSQYLPQFLFYSDDERVFRFLRNEVLKPVGYHSVMTSLIARSGLSPADIGRTVWMTDQDLSCLHQRDHVIGLHSYSHPIRLAELPTGQQETEYVRNFNHLTAVTGVRPRTVAHPCNSYGPETLDILAELGIRLGFCSSYRGQSSHLLEIPREDASNILIALGRRGQKPAITTSKLKV